MSGNTTRLAVLGSPIDHSRSPSLHAAAYAVLGLPWRYEAIEMTGERLPEFVESRDATWRGLSLTMPLKRHVIPLLDERDDFIDITGGANTVLFDRSGPTTVLRGFNTDVYGVSQAFREAGVDRLDTVQVLGAGATAASVIVAVAQLGAKGVTVSARTPAKAQSLVALGSAIGVQVTVAQLGQPLPAIPDAIVSTLPGHGDHELVFAEPVRATAVLFDVAYDPWPSALAGAWAEAGGVVISGLEMLLHQAVAQVRIFVNGSPDVPVADEDVVVAAMRASIAS